MIINFIELQCEAARARIAPEIGANILSWEMLAGNDQWQHILEPFDIRTFEENNSVSGIPILAPYCGRLGLNQSGAFSFAGISYREPHGRHGFLRHCAWEVEKHDMSMVCLVCVLDRRSKAGEFPYYIKYEYSIFLTEDSLKLKLDCTGLADNDQPISIGWHPYFLAPRPCKVMIDAEYKLELDNNPEPVPTTKFTKLEDTERLTPPRLLRPDEHWDDILVLRDSPDGSLAQIRSGQIELCVEADRASFPFMQLYTPVGRDSVCLEPLSHAPNAFNNPIQNSNTLLGPQHTQSWELLFRATVD